MNKLRNQELLNRIEKLETLTKRLEQAIQDIWGACGCLNKDIDIDDDITHCYELPDIEEPEEELPSEEIIEHE